MGWFRRCYYSSGRYAGAYNRHSGGAESLANYFSRKFSDKRTIRYADYWQRSPRIPVFFDVGFLFCADHLRFCQVAKISPLKFGLPVAGIMLTVHVGSTAA
ncbi:hypothetical protein ACNKHP_07335 [Shigella boydii]